MLVDGQVQIYEGFFLGFGYGTRRVIVPFSPFGFVFLLLAGPFLRIVDQDSFLFCQVVYHKLAADGGGLTRGDLLVEGLVHSVALFFGDWHDVVVGTYLGGMIEFGLVQGDDGEILSALVARFLAVDI